MSIGICPPGCHCKSQSLCVCALSTEHMTFSELLIRSIGLVTVSRLGIAYIFAIHSVDLQDEVNICIAKWCIYETVFGENTVSATHFHRL